VIYADMLTYSRPPNDLFIGSDASKRAVLDAISRAQGR
jgi:hypothetical protein